MYRDFVFWSGNLVRNLRERRLNSKYSLELYKLLKRRGLRASDLKPAELAMLAVKAAGPVKTVEAGVKVAASLVRTKVFGVKVPLEIYEERKAGCKSNRCGFFALGANDGIICKKCGCSGKLMDSALNDPYESCRMPVGQKIWDKYDANNS